jgi:hypothetical protein
MQLKIIGVLFTCLQLIEQSFFITNLNALFTVDYEQVHYFQYFQYFQSSLEILII